MSLEDSSVNINEGAESLETMQNLMDEVVEIQKTNVRSENTIQRVKEIVQECSDIMETSKVPFLTVLDAQILHKSTNIVKDSVMSFDTNLTAFKVEEYSNGIMEYLQNDSVGFMRDDAWEGLAPLVCHLYKKSMPISYMLGTFTFDPPPRGKERKKPEKHIKNECEKRVLNTYKSQEKEPEDSDQVYEYILRCLIKAYRKNDKKPVNYFKFIIDPNSYWETVENIFHFAFLVRDAQVQMTVNDEGIPTVEPDPQNKGKGGRKQNNQFNFRLSIQEWKDFIEIFQITSPSIPQFRKSHP